MSEPGVMTRRRSRRLHRSALPATPLDDDDLLGQILLRLPPSPSSLPRASIVCKRWRRVMSCPYFLRSFCAHHRKAPLLGFLFQNHIGAGVGFTSPLDAPDRIAEERFTLQVPGYCVLGCRHGRILAVDQEKHTFLVWDPVTGHQFSLPAPPAVNPLSVRMNGAIICAATDKGHTHGACHSSPFQVVMVDARWEGLSACIYSSETSSWGDVISMSWQSLFPTENKMRPFIPISLSSTMVGNHICWLLLGLPGAILQFDLLVQSFAVIEVPPGSYDNHAFAHGKCQFLVTRTDAGGIGFLVLSGFSVRLWKRNVNSDGVAAGWVLGNTIELSSLLLLSLDVYSKRPMIVGYAEDDNVIVLRTEDCVFMLQLETLKFNKLFARMDQHQPTYLPFTSFYPAGT